ncbi:MAG TPA: hypothetical protein VLJ39_14870 [Tepidisphaeraceae bacterium]|jgi:hypothetical protein|nr:hypothetical protein [Tepidisphaeraceae bacterium]
MRSLAAVLALGAAFTLTPAFVQAAPAQAHVQKIAEKKAHAMHGTVSSVDGDTVTVSIENKKTGTKKDHPVKTDSNTKVTVDGKDAKVSDLKAGMLVSITPGTEKGAAASQIEATSAAKS